MDQTKNGCRIQNKECSCGFGCVSEFRYDNMQECQNALRGRWLPTIPFTLLEKLKYPIEKIFSYLITIPTNLQETEETSATQTLVCTVVPVFKSLNTPNTDAGAKELDISVYDVTEVYF